MDRAGQGWLRVGVVGRAHGLDGSFYVAEPVSGLLTIDRAVRVGERAETVARRAGTDARPIIRLRGISTRSAAEALRGHELTVAREEAPPLEADEWWAEDLEGCRVTDGSVDVGVVRRMLALPSCEVLEVERPGREDLLVPLVADAVREVDVAGHEIDIDLAFLGEAGVPGAAESPGPTGHAPGESAHGS